MKSACVFLLALSGASAFAPAQTARSATRLAATEELTGLRGVGLESGGKIFDPMGLAQWASVEHLRKAELSNGRSAMLATVGWVWPSWVGTFNSDDVTTTDPIKAILDADPQWWAQWIVFCGVIEGIKYRSELEGKSYTGDGPAAVDWSGNWAGLTAEQKEDMAMKEIKNGRLAMIGFAGFLSNYFIPGSVPFTPDV